MKKLVLTELEHNNRVAAKRRKRRKVLAIFAASVLFSIVAQVVVDHTIGRFPDLYGAIDFNNNFEREDIICIFYGDTTATVMYNAGMESYYHNDGYWVFTGWQGQDVDVGIGRLSIFKTAKGSDWCVNAFFRTDQCADGEDVLIDCYGTKLSQYEANDYVRSYFAYIHPQSKNYSISVNGKEFEIELKRYDRWIPFMSE